jgi:hypothetical protein
MKRRLLTIGATGAIIASAASCGPPPAVGVPALCGQTADGKAVVALVVDLGRCTAAPGQLQIGVADPCGPIMAGTNAIDDCWRGSIPGLPSPDNFRLGHIQAAGGTAINFVASDATAA